MLGGRQGGVVGCGHLLGVGVDEGHGFLGEVAALRDGAEAKGESDPEATSE